MKLLKYLCALALAFALLSGCCGSAQTPLSYSKGDKIQDFTFTTYDGQTITLSDVLKEKEAVLINIWATWCGPCRNEFPFLEEAYKQYQDRVEVIALSCDPSDSPDKLKVFAAQYGLTFKIGQDPVGFLSALRLSSIPVTLMIDRFGTICLIASGSQPDAESFTRMFDAFLGSDYTESVIFDGIPPMKPNIAPADEGDLSAALDAHAVNPTHPYTWPMAIVKEDGRIAVHSTNAGHASSTSAISIHANANAGDVVAVTFKTSTARLSDFLNISLNGKVVKVFSGDHDWMTYAIPVQENGQQTLTLSYTKDASGNTGSDMVWIDCVEVLTGDAAEAALAANPAYPTSAECSLTITNPEAQEIVIEDPRGVLSSHFGPAKYYLLNGSTASFAATLTSEHDPETAFFYCDYDGSIIPVTAGMTSDCYTAHAGVDSAETTRYTYTAMFLYGSASGPALNTVVYFKDEANLNQFVNGNQLGSWSYAASSATSSYIDKPAGSSAYAIRCVDQNGQPVPGALLQICNDSTCEVVTTDENGIYAFSAAPYAWEIHVLRAPQGYAADSVIPVSFPVEGGEIVLTFTSN